MDSIFDFLDSQDSGDLFDYTPFFSDNIFSTVPFPPIVSTLGIPVPEARQRPPWQHQPLPEAFGSQFGSLRQSGSSASEVPHPHPRDGDLGRESRQHQQDQSQSQSQGQRQPQQQPQQQQHQQQHQQPQPSQQPCLPSLRDSQPNTSLNFSPTLPALNPQLPAGAMPHSPLNSDAIEALIGGDIFSSSSPPPPPPFASARPGPSSLISTDTQARTSSSARQPAAVPSSPPSFASPFRRTSRRPQAGTPAPRSRAGPDASLARNDPSAPGTMPVDRRSAARAAAAGTPRGTPQTSEQPRRTATAAAARRRRENPPPPKRRRVNSRGASTPAGAPGPSQARAAHGLDPDEGEGAGLAENSDGPIVDLVDRDEVPEQKQPPPPPPPDNRVKLGAFQCTICFDDVTELRVTHCGHLYCSECLIAALLTNNGPQHIIAPKPRCPICRAKIDLKPRAQYNSKSKGYWPLQLKISTRPRNPPSQP